VGAGTAVNWFSLDSLKHFEIIDKGKLDSSTTDAGIAYSQHITLTSFDSGSRVIPPFRITINGTDYLTDSVRMEVNFSKFDPNQDYHDIKDIIEVENPSVKYILWIIIAMTVISTAAVILFLKMKKVIKLVYQKPVSGKSALEEAMQALAELKKEHLAESGQVKLYYTRLNDILRTFLFRRWRISSLEKTNEELILQVRQLGLPETQFYKLSEALRMADFVKFAKYVPGAEDNDQNMEVVGSSLKSLNEIEK
jgi:hypothetical protein